MTVVKSFPKSATLLLFFFFFLELVSAAENSQVKEATSLEQGTLPVFGPQKESIKQQIHRMFLLRVKLMHFVNSLHNYIMTRVCLLSQFHLY